MSAPEQTDPAVVAAEAELARLRAEADAAEAQLKAAQARAALAAAEAAAAKARAGCPAAADPHGRVAEPAPVADAQPVAEPAPVGDAQPVAEPVDAGGSGPLDPDQVATVVAGYTFDATTLDLGALVNGDPVASAQIRIPLAMMNRHGLVAGATGTGKTRTLQGLAEQLAAQGRPGVRRGHQGRPLGRRNPR